MGDKLNMALKQNLCVFDVSSRLNDSRHVLGTETYLEDVGEKVANEWLKPQPNCNPHSGVAALIDCTYAVYSMR